MDHCIKAAITIAACRINRSGNDGLKGRFFCFAQPFLDSLIIGGFQRFLRKPVDLSQGLLQGSFS